MIFSSFCDRQPTFAAPGQVLLFLGWCGAAFDAAAATGKHVVWLNMDETMIAYAYKGQRGSVVNPQFWDDVNGCLLSDGTNPSEVKTNMTFLACIASDHTVQRQLPQVLKAQEKKFPQGLQDVAHHLMPENVVLLLDQSIWMTQDTFEQYLCFLHSFLEPLMNPWGPPA